MRYIILFFMMLIFFACTSKVVKQPAAPKPESKEIKYLWAYKKIVNVRTENSANSDKLTSLSDGDSVQVLQNNDGWYKIIIGSGKKGWIRSDLLGTKNMSVFPKAVAFSNKLKEDNNITLYFDKDIQHKRIFLEFPAIEYTSKQNIENKTIEIGKNYQERVYQGKVSIHVIEPKDQSEYLSINLGGSINADINLPVLKFGILTDLNVKSDNELYLDIIVNENIDNAQLLKEARKIAGSFPLTLKKVMITFKNKSQKCILSFMEDASGEDYKFNQCL